MMPVTQPCLQRARMPSKQLIEPLIGAVTRRLKTG